ncbi:neurofilament medium polypeptide isoform X3 [Plutella xylostella]|uniref:neurofilament medium polypeptide isoform X3 n=1 Tax=Plutella xylostella TaxID=51655 RepID=UPI0020326F93|nr:neurofilament medium polypeptide isoform X3 [Plutella xylostella]
MARKQAVTIQDTVETNDEFERYLLDNRDKLICMEVYSEFCGYCLAAGNAVKKIKLEIGGDRVSMVKAVADNITSLVRFKDKSEPVFLFISGGKLTRAVFGANAIELCQVAEEELGIQAKELETGVPRAQPIREVHEMLPEEAEKMEADLQAEKEYLEEIERARLQTLYERKRRVNERLSSAVLTLNYILFWPHCHHAHYDLYEKWDTINVSVAGKETLQLTKDDLDEVFYQSDILPNEACIHALLDGEAMVVLFKMPDGDDRDFVQVMRKALYEDTPARKDDVSLDKQPPPVPAYERYATVSKSKREVRRDRYNEKMRKLQEEKEERERLAAERARLAKQAEDDRIAEEKRRKEEERFARIQAGLPADPEPEEPPPTEGADAGEAEKKEGEEDKKEGEGEKKEGEEEKKEEEGDKKEGEGDKKEGEEDKKEGEENKKAGEVNKQEGDDSKKDADDATNTEATVTDTEGRSERTETTAGTESVAATDVTEGTEPTTVATETTAAPSEGEQPQPNPEDPEPEPLEEILQEFHSDVSIEGEEYIPPPGLFIPGLYTPGNHLARANGLAFFYPKYISRIAPIESEKLPPHVLVMFPVERRAELQDLLETYKDEILNIGVFAVENDLSQAEHVAYSIRQYNKMDRPMKHKERVALMVSAARSLPLLQLGARGPVYLSGDASAGERDCLRMFPVGYGDGFVDEEADEVEITAPPPPSAPESEPGTEALPPLSAPESEPGTEMVAETVPSRKSSKEDKDATKLEDAPKTEDEKGAELPGEVAKTEGEPKPEQPLDDIKVEDTTIQDKVKSADKIVEKKPSLDNKPDVTNDEKVVDEKTEGEKPVVAEDTTVIEKVKVEEDQKIEEKVSIDKNMGDTKIDDADKKHEEKKVEDAVIEEGPKGDEAKPERKKYKGRHVKIFK